MPGTAAGRRTPRRAATTASPSSRATCTRVRRGASAERWAEERRAAGGKVLAQGTCVQPCQSKNLPQANNPILKTPIFNQLRQVSSLGHIVSSGAVVAAVVANWTGGRTHKLRADGRTITVPQDPEPVPQRLCGARAAQFYCAASCNSAVLCECGACSAPPPWRSVRTGDTG